MTQEDKQLLLIDLCARLPYGVICDMWFERNPEDKITEVLKCGGLMRLMNNVFDFMAKPYLRPMSSMTEEEEVELNNILPCGMSFSYTTKGKLIIYTDPEYDCDHSFCSFVKIQDWLNAHHFDYRGLIPMGLALKAKEGMYEQKN